MSRLNDLMHAYCPDGVGFQPLGKLTTIRNGFTYNADKVMTRPYKVSRIETISSGRINMDRVATVDSVNQSYKLQEGDILFSHINSIQYLGNCAYYTESIGELYHGMNLLNIHSINPDELLPRFLFYYMRTYQWWLNIYRDAKHAVNQCSLSTSDMKKWLVPVPPIEVQREVVRVLDSFQELDATLNEELETRERQLEHYRHGFIFDIQSYPTAPLGSIAPYSKDRIDSTAIQPDNYVGVDTLLQNKRGRTSSPGTTVPSGRLIAFHEGDTLLGNIRPYLKKIWFADCDGGANGDVLVLHSACTIDSRYLYYVVFSDDFFLFDVGKSKGSKMPRGDKKAISSYPIPLPSIETQREIVAKLDAMQALIDSIRAEREARHKQFEHYRDRILDFPRKA